MSWTYFIKIGGKNYTIGTSYGGMFALNIIEFYEIVCYLEKCGKNVSIEKLVVYTMCVIASNLHEKWDEKCLDKVYVKDRFRQLFYLIKKEGGVALNEEDEEYSLDYIFNRIFDDDERQQSYLPESVVYKFKNKIVTEYCYNQSHYKENVKIYNKKLSLFKKYTECDKCNYFNSTSNKKIKVIDLCQECIKNIDDDDGYLCSFYTHLIAGVKCTIH